jgi:hypothetical protein
MATWAEIEQDEPQFAARVRARFESGIHKTLATLRSDGSPRISGSELTFSDGQVSLGMMAGSLKLRDVRRDPRVALHSPTPDPPKDDPSRWAGDATLAGTVRTTAAPAESAQPGAGYFTLDVVEAVLTYVGTPADHLVIESWHEGRGYQRRTRA